MEYLMAAGSLYEESGGHMLARIRGFLSGTERRIVSPEGKLVLRTEVRDGAADGAGGREYVMQDENGVDCAVALPDYADGEDPAQAGWPVCRMPRVDRAQVRIGADRYRLVMDSSRSYTLWDQTGHSLVHIVHRGVAGGWNIQDEGRFRPELIVGIFVFCRYIEKENEFAAV